MSALVTITESGSNNTGDKINHNPKNLFQYPLVVKSKRRSVVSHSHNKREKTKKGEPFRATPVSASK